MRDRTQRFLMLSVSLLAFSGILTIAATRLFQTWHILILTVAIVLAPIGEHLDRNYRVFRRITFPLTLLFTVALPFWFAVWGIYRGVVGLVVFILVHKFIHTKKSRDYYQIILMSFALLLAAGSHQPSAAIAPSLLLFFVAAVFSLMGIHAWREVHGASSDVVLFGFDASAASRKRNSSAIQQSTGMGKWGVLIFGLCFLLTLGLFLTTPRIDAGLIQFEPSNSATTGADTLIELAQMGPIIPDSSIVMRVRFPEEIRGLPQTNLYWRLTTFHDLFGSRWERAKISKVWSEAVGEEQLVQVDDYTVRRVPPRSNRRRIYQQISLERASRVGLPYLGLPLQVKSSESRIFWDPQSDYTIIPAETGKPLNYEVWSETPSFSPEDLRNAPGNYAQLGAPDYSFLVRHSLSRRAVELAREVTSGQTTIYDKVSTLERWFHSDQFQYSYNPPRYSGANPVTVFLMQTRTGHCELFATAMAMMVRSLGIPARVVSGYRGGNWDESTRTLYVRQDAAHLWVEVYFMGYGWVPFDPTPTSEELSQRQRQGLWSTNRFLLMLQFAWYRNVEGYQSAALWRGLKTFVLSLMATRFGIPGFGLALTLGVLGIVGYYVGVALKARARPRSFAYGETYALTPDQIRAQRLFRRLKKHVQRLGIGIEGMTASELLQSAVAANILSPDILEQVVSVYNRARFGGGTLTAGEYRDLVGRLRASKSG